MEKIAIYDSTLRDGAQAEGISFSLQDKLRIARILDDMEAEYIEAGNPGSNPKDMELFEQLAGRPLRHARLVAFGSTRRKDTDVETDAGIRSLLASGAPCIAVVGKAWDRHVRRILRTELEENLRMIRQTVAYLKSRGKEVVFDAEHFFDGYRGNPDYAMAALQAAYEGGADCLCLCDTNGGAFPDYIGEVTARTAGRFPVRIGIHTHDDGGMAVAGSILAVKAGARMVQGTFDGFGERCGNANLSTVIADLQLKQGFSCIPQPHLRQLTRTAREIAELANVSVGSQTPYVGSNAFAHKGGMHVDGVAKDSRAFEHVSPSAVGNIRKILLSEVAGRSTVIGKVRAFYPSITKDSEQAARIMEMVKRLEFEGYQFEGAEASFELAVRRLFGENPRFFELDRLSVVDEQTEKDGYRPAFATIKVIVGGRPEITAAEGNGPVNAIDSALRKALEVFYPEIGRMRLADYKVRVLDSRSATAAKVRVLIESTDGREYWSTVGVAVDIIQASCTALIDSIVYRLMKSSRAPLPGAAGKSDG